MKTSLYPFWLSVELPTNAVRPGPPTAPYSRSEFAELGERKLWMGLVICAKPLAETPYPPVVGNACALPACESINWPVNVYALIPSNVIVPIRLRAGRVALGAAAGIGKTCRTKEAPFTGPVAL